MKNKIKDDLIILAAEKGYFGDVDPYDNDDRYYIWMSLLQKWLRDNKEYSVDINWYVTHEKIYEFWVRKNKSGEKISINLMYQFRFDNYEDTLESGLLHCLKKIE